MKKRTVSIIVILLFITLLAVINYKQKPLTKTDFKLNTMVTITVYDGDEKLLNGCMEICDKYENVFSRTDENSELYMLNHGLLKKDSDGYMQVSDELYQLIQDGLLYMELTDGIIPSADYWNEYGWVHWIGVGVDITTISPTFHVSLGAQFHVISVPLEYAMILPCSSVRNI